MSPLRSILILSAIAAAPILIGAPPAVVGLRDESDASAADVRANAEVRPLEDMPVFRDGATAAPAVEAAAPSPELATRLANAEESVRVLTLGMTEASEEATRYREQYNDLRLRMEALGLDAADREREPLEQRLLQAVNDLRLARQENELLRKQIAGLSDAIQPYLATAETARTDLREAVEAELLAASDLLAGVLETPERADLPTLTDGRVISVKQEYSLVVANLGTEQGVQIGMPFGVYREGRQVAAVRVVDVRTRIAGAVVEDFSEGVARVEVGDQLRVETNL